MTPHTNPLVTATAEPAILEARSWLDRYDGGFGPIMDLSQAAPPYPPSDALLDRLAASARDGETARYGAVRGEAALKAAYRDHLQTIYGGTIEHDGITITAGCNQAFFVTALSLLRQGDRALLPSPWYFNHRMTLDMLGVGVTPLPCGATTGYLPDVEAAEALMDGTVRAVVLVTPNNPTGAEYPAALIERFYELCRRKGVWLILDETYRDFRQDMSVPPHGLAANAWPEGLVGLYSFSKAYAVPGHRLGAITAPVTLSSGLLKVQDCVQICAGRSIQMAITWSIANLDAWKADRRRDIGQAAAALRSAVDGTGWEIVSLGAYFAYVRHPFGQTSSHEVARELAQECGVLLIPGSSFGPGQDQYLRLSFPSLTGDMCLDLAERLNRFQSIERRSDL